MIAEAIIDPAQRSRFPKLFLLAIALCGLTIPTALAQQQRPEWCRPLPRPEYKTLERVPISDPWFEVYRVATGVFAIYEPHQSEETISYLIAGKTKAVLVDSVNMILPHVIGPDFHPTLLGEMSGK